MSNAIRSFGVARALCVAVLFSWFWAAPALAQDFMVATKVPIKSVASKETKAEQIKFTGEATIKSRVARDPELSNHTLELLIQMDGVAGTGEATLKKYTVSTWESTVKPHAPTQTVQFDFPVFESADIPLSQVRLATVTFTFNVDMATGVISKAVGLVTTR